MVEPGEEIQEVIKGQVAVCVRAINIIILPHFSSFPLFTGRFRHLRMGPKHLDLLILCGPVSA